MFISFWESVNEKTQIISTRAVSTSLKINIGPCNYILNKINRNGLRKSQWFRRIWCVFYPCFHLVLMVIVIKGTPCLTHF